MQIHCTYRATKPRLFAAWGLLKLSLFHFHQIDSDSAEARAAMVLAGLGFDAQMQARSERKSKPRRPCLLFFSSGAVFTSSRGFPSGVFLSCPQMMKTREFSGGWRMRIALAQARHPTPTHLHPPHLPRFAERVRDSASLPLACACAAGPVVPAANRHRAPKAASVQSHQAR